MIFINLPLEIIELILNKLNDTKSFLRMRLVCKTTYNILSDVKIFEKGNLKKIIVFNNDSIYYYTSNNNLIKEVNFLKYGEIKTIRHKYEDNSHDVNLNIIDNKFTVKENNPNNYIINNYNFITNDISKQVIPKINFPCLIS
tara:strand:- start:702 stop:1127 length:426 start_codon:yes stop_codon:yes gene_type:complete